MPRDDFFDRIRADLAANALHAALVRCWHYLKTDQTVFLRAEAKALDDRQAHERAKDGIVKALLSRTTLHIDNIDWPPLATLEILDRFLFERFDAGHGLAPPVQVPVDDALSYFVTRRQIAFAEPPRHSGQTGHLHSWLRWHWIAPTGIGGFQVRVAPLRAPSRAILASRLEKERIRVFTAGFADGVELDLDQEGPGTFLVREIVDPEARWSTISSALDAAARLRADIVVLPELTVSPGLRLRVADWLEDHRHHPFSLVVPGSFHERRGSKTYNRAEMLGAFGGVVLWHHKLTRFGDKDMSEGIVSGDSIELLNTPVGLVAMPICRDFCDEDAFFSLLWQELAPDWILVPAMGEQTSISAHLRRSGQLLRAYGCACAVANQPRAAKGCACTDACQCHGFVSALGAMDEGGAEKVQTCVRVPIKPRAIK